MNRTILIVICDFLLVSLLAFSTVDINKVADEGSDRQVRVDIATNRVESGRHLAAVMRLALEEERQKRDLLLGELEKSREATDQKQALLGERERQVQAFQQQLQSRDQEARLLQERQAGLQQQFDTAQAGAQALNQKLQSSSADALLSKEKLAVLEAEMRKQTEQAAALQEQLAQLAKSNQMVQIEKERLSSQLQVAEVEKLHATEQATRMQELVKVERDEKAHLAEGVKALASRSSELAQEMRENRPLAPNTIFNEFASNRVRANLTASRSGLLGSTRRKETETVLVSDGTNVYALCHVQDTPFTFWSPSTDWDGITGTLAHDATHLPVRKLSFHLQDPRVVLMPVTSTEVRQLGCKVYRVSADPFKFQDAVLVGAREGYYGECRFQIDLTTPEYVKLDRDVLKGLFGKFNPSRGDLVFSKTGELLGIMANGTYCMMLRHFQSAATFELAEDVRTQGTGATLTGLYAILTGMPLKLQ